MAPAGTPKDIIARLNAEVVKAVRDPEVRRKLEDLGFAVRGSSAEELRAMTRDQLTKYARVIKEMGIANEGKRRPTADRFASPSVAEVPPAVAAAIGLRALRAGIGAPG